MTRKRFTKLLMGRHGFSRNAARSAAMAVTCYGKPADKWDFFYHSPNHDYASEFDLLDFCYRYTKSDEILIGGLCNDLDS